MDRNATYLYLLHFKNSWAQKENLPDVSSFENKYYWNLNRDIVKVEIDCHNDVIQEMQLNRADTEENTETIDFQVKYGHVCSDMKFLHDSSGVTVIQDGSGKTDETLVHKSSDEKLARDSSDATDVPHIFDRSNAEVAYNSSNVTILNCGSDVIFANSSSGLTDVNLKQDTSVVSDRSDGTKVTLVHNGLDVNSVPNSLSVADVSSLTRETTWQMKLECPKCDKICSTKGGFKIHMSVHDKRRICKTCGLSFRTITSLKRHRKSHVRKPSVCRPYCKKIFGTQQNLDEHILSHSEAEVQLNKCQVCYLVFSTSGDLKDHLRSHSASLKPYICEICKKRFAQRSDLKSHNTTSHWCANTAVGEEWFS